MKILILCLFSISLAYAKFHPTKASPKWQIELVDISNCVITDHAFLVEVATIPRFDYTEDSGLEVSLNLQKNVDAFLTTYRSWYRFSKVNAYRDEGSNIVRFNTRNNPRSKESMANTSIHEILHILGYGHNGNGTENDGRKFSVNYYVGSLAEKYVKDCLKR